MIGRVDAVLINPSNPGGVTGRAFASESLALAYLSASLQQRGARVRIVDCDLEGLSPEVMACAIAGASPVLAGITALARNSDEAVAIARAIRRAAPGVPIVVGGLHFTYCADHLLSSVPEIDFVVRGEGEAALGQLFDALRSGRPGSMASVGNLTYRDGRGAIRSNPCLPALRDLDALPRPDRQVLERALAAGLRPAIPVLASRGCYGRCLFCNASEYYVTGGGRSWRGRSARSVVDEIELLTETYGERVDPVLLFYDDTFIGPGAQGRARAGEIAREIIRRGLNVRFETFLRADTFSDDDALVALLRRAGMVRVFMGIEASDDEDLRRMRKGTDTAMVRRAIANLRRNRVAAPASGFIMFEPYSTWEGLRRSAEFLRSLGHASIWNLSTKLDVYGGNRFASALQADGLLTGSTCHGGYFTYAFKDRRVGAFSQYMDLSGHPVVQRLDASGRFVEFDHAALLFEAEQLGVRVAEDDAVCASLLAIQERSYRFFLRALELFERGGAEAEARAEKERFLRDLDFLTNQLEAAHEAFLRDIANRVAHA